MTQKQSLLLGLGVAFISGVGLTLVLVQPTTGNISGNILNNQQNQQPVRQNQPQCQQHEECPDGNVCKLGQCVQAERSFCSQEFMLAQSLEGRFIRYTLCENKCIRSGDSAYCK